MNSSSDSVAPQSCAICSVCAACPEEGWDTGPGLSGESGGVGQHGIWLFLRDQHTEKCPHPAPAMRQGLGDTQPTCFSQEENELVHHHSDI